MTKRSTFRGPSESPGPLGRGRPGSRRLRSALSAAVVLGVLLAALPSSLPSPGLARPGLSSPSGPIVAAHAERGSVAAPAARLRAPAIRTAAGNASPQWINAAPASAVQLPVIESTAGAWDAADGYFLVTGGDSDSGIFDRSWAYAAGNWTDLTTSGGLGPIEGQSMAYDPGLGAVVLFGGLRSTDPLEYNNTTWTYRAGLWTAHPGGVAPAGRFGASMVYDPALGGELLFGGLNLTTTTTTLRDTWLYKNGTWTALHPATSPPARWLGMMAYDPVLAAVVLYGGADAAETPMNDTWLFANGTWTSEPTGPSGPTALADGMMVYDPDLGSVVMADGFNASEGFPNATWSYGPSGWSALATTGAHGGRYSGVGIWDPVDHEFVLAGGNETSERTDALVLPLAIGALGGPTTGEEGHWASFAPTVLGGPRPASYAWSVGGVLSNLTENASFEFADAGNYSIALTATAADGQIVRVAETFGVVPGPSVSVAVPLQGVDIGVNLTLSANITNGVAPFSVSWSFSDGSTGNGSVVQHAWPGSGPAWVIAHVVDAAGGTATTDAPFVVNPMPSIAIVQSYPSSAPGEAGVPVSLTATVSGGTPPLIVRWAFATGANATGPSVNETFGAAGTYAISADVTDADGASAGVGEELSIVAAVSAELSGPDQLSAGTVGSWTVGISGGVGPFTLNWSAPGSSASSGGTNRSITFGTPGTYRVEIVVHDSLGGVAVAEKNVTVTAAPSSAAPFAAPATLVGLAVVGIVVVGVVALVVRRALRARRPPPT